MAKSEIIKVQEGDTVIELTGANKEAFIADREERLVQSRLVETEQLAKQTARESAIKKLAEVAGLTEEEIEGLVR